MNDTDLPANWVTMNCVTPADVLQQFLSNIPVPALEYLVLDPDPAHLYEGAPWVPGVALGYDITLN